MIYSFVLTLFFSLMLFKAAPVQAAKQVYPQGCPDTVKVIKLLKEGDVAEVLKELTTFNKFVRVITKPCNILVHKLYGIAYLAQEPDLAKMHWRTMLHLNPRAEIFDLSILSYKIQSQFDKVKSEMVKGGQIKNAYSDDYIPPVYPNPKDSQRTETEKKFFHELRLYAFSGDFEYSRIKLKDSIQSYVKRGEAVDPAFMILEGDLRTRRIPHRGDAVFEASTLIQNGLEVLRQKGSVLVEPSALEDWARRLKTRVAVAENIK